MTPLPDLLSIRVWALGAAFERRLAKELAPMGLTVPAFRLIGEVMREPEGVRQNELARRLGVSAPTISAALKRLEQAGLVHRIEDPEDPRARRVLLSPEAPLGPGQDVLERLDAALVADLDAHTLATLTEQLDRWTRALAEEEQS